MRVEVNYIQTNKLCLSSPRLSAIALKKLHRELASSFLPLFREQKSDFWRWKADGAHIYEGLGMKQDPFVMLTHMPTGYSYLLYCIWGFSESQHEIKSGSS